MKTILTGILILTLTTIPSSVSRVSATKAVTENKFGNCAVQSISNEDAIEPYGLITSIRASIKGKDGIIYAVAKNTFTLFPSKVQVYIELYSSNSFQEDFRNMTMICRNYTDDLNMGKSIETSAPTEGFQKYWKARAHYCMDGKAWNETVTDTMLYNAQGEIAF